MANFGYTILKHNGYSIVFYTPISRLKDGLLLESKIDLYKSILTSKDLIHAACPVFYCSSSSAAPDLNFKIISQNRI